MKRIIIITLVIIVIIDCIFTLYARDRLNTQDRYIEQLEKLPSVSDIQQRLVDLGWNIKVDGKLSPDWRNSRTQTVWDAEVHNQFAAKYMTDSGAPK